MVQLRVWALFVVIVQTLAGGQGGRRHGDGPTAASSGVGVSDLRGRSRLSERPEHGGAAIPRQTVRQPRHRLQVSHPGLTFGITNVYFHQPLFIQG